MKQMQLILIAGLCLMALAAFAQQQPPPPAQGEERHGQHGAHGMPSVDDHVKMLSEKLNLTEDQQAKVKSLFEAQRTQMQALMKDDSLSPDARRDKARSIHDETHAKIRDLLTDDQKKKFDAMQAEMQEHMRQHHPPSAGDNPPKPN
jgi:protein CpxP